MFGTLFIGPLIWIAVLMVYTWWLWAIWLCIVLVQSGSAAMLRTALGIFGVLYALAFVFVLIGVSNGAYH